MAALVRAGYEHRGEQGIPGREFFRRGTPRAFHVHLAETDGPVWREMLRFRDALRADPALAAEYAELKLRLAARFPRDREAYLGGKGPFIAGVLRRAAETGPP
ncbi:MAG TPA: GrpB family protein [Longimicrobiaceae bacterium]|nr:GrpB family protein [Longimicrobiaceae bacterium]